MGRPRRRSRWSGRRAWSSWSAAAAHLDGPLYAAVGAGPAHQSGFGTSHAGRTVTVTLHVGHAREGGGELEVSTADEPTRSAGGLDEWRLASDWATRAVRPEVLDFPLELRADRWERDVPVDGVPVDGVPVAFLFVGGDDTWSAAGRPGGREVLVRGTGWPHAGLALARVDVRDVPVQAPVV